VSESGRELPQPEQMVLAVPRAAPRVRTVPRWQFAAAHHTPRPALQGFVGQRQNFGRARLADLPRSSESAHGAHEHAAPLALALVRLVDLVTTGRAVVRLLARLTR